MNNCARVCVCVCVFVCVCGGTNECIFFFRGKEIKNRLTHVREHTGILQRMSVSVYVSDEHRKVPLFNTPLIFFFYISETVASSKSVLFCFF